MPFKAWPAPLDSAPSSLVSNRCSRRSSGPASSTGVLGRSGAEVSGGRAVPPIRPRENSSISSAAGWRQGFVSNITNLKMLVFYLAVLPQFLGPHPSLPALVALGLSHAAHLCSIFSLSSPVLREPAAYSSTGPCVADSKCHDRRRPPRLWRQAGGGRQVGAQPPSGTASARTEKDRHAERRC
jgi:hypothetical protein